MFGSNSIIRISVRFVAVAALMACFSLPSLAQEGPEPDVPVKPATAKATQSGSMTAAERIKAATQKLEKKKKYSLKYNMKLGEKLRWYHEHVHTSKSRMAGVATDTSSRVETVLIWGVKSIDKLDRVTFEIELESVNTWQQNGDDKPVAYDSKKKQKVPDLYIPLSERVGKPMSQYMITRNGQIADSKSYYRKSDIGGIGDTPTFPFPDKPISVGHDWNVPDTLRAKNEHGVYQNLKVQVHYELMKVKANKAYISFKTQVLTPLESEKVKSQILTHLSKGYIVFDLKRGLPIRREVEWDEKVQGYSGPDSYLKYTARRSEKLLVGRSIADKNLPKTHAMLKPIPTMKPVVGKKPTSGKPGVDNEVDKPKAGSNGPEPAKAPDNKKPAASAKEPAATAKEPSGTAKEPSAKK